MSSYEYKPQQERPKGLEILRIADIPFYLTTGFGLFMGLVMLLVIYSWGQSPVMGGLLCFVIFFSLMVHEGGHAIAARLAGLRNIQVSLVMFGGQTSHPPTSRGRSLAIVLAGPAATLILVIVSRVVLSILTGEGQNDSQAIRFVLGNFFLLNLFWLVLNLLPIYPMDGGQAILYTLSFFRPFPVALRWCAVLSIATAGLGLLGMHTMGWQEPILVIFAILFILQNVQLLRGLR